MAFDSQENEGQSGLIGGPSTGWRSAPGAWLSSEWFRVRESEALAPIPARRNGLQVEAKEASFRSEAEIYETLDPSSWTTSSDTILGLSGDLHVATRRRASSFFLSPTARINGAASCLSHHYLLEPPLAMHGSCVERGFFSPR